MRQGILERDLLALIAGRVDVGDVIGDGGVTCGQPIQRTLRHQKCVGVEEAIQHRRTSNSSRAARVDRRFMKSVRGVTSVPNPLGHWHYWQESGWFLGESRER